MQIILISKLNFYANTKCISNYPHFRKFDSSCDIHMTEVLLYCNGAILKIIVMISWENDSFIGYYGDSEQK
ncbi:hypothetical protein Trydic_g18850 [Trypoxylus dichotomus]